MRPTQFRNATAERLRVLHIITGLNNGGAEAVLYRLVLNDAADTHHVVSLTGDDKYGPLLRAAGAEVTVLGMPRGRVTLRGLRGLNRVVRSWQPDVVQTWMYHADLLGGVVARLAGVPVAPSVTIVVRSSESKLKGRMET